MDISQKSVLITGANRGIGRALVNEALRRGARRVYAGTRGGSVSTDERVVTVALDVTDPAHIADAAAQIGDLDMVINNAGVASYGDLGDLDNLQGHLAVNLFGVLNVSRAFLPQLRRSQGALVNVLSLASLASVPVMPAYSISKAAAFNLTQGLRAFLTPQGIRVHAVVLGPIDTDMTRGLELPKTSAELAARGTFDGLTAGEEDIFPDPVSAPLAGARRDGAAKSLERQFSAFVPAASAAA